MKKVLATRSSILALLAGSLSVSLPVVASAQEAQAEQGSGVADIVVTARKREESLQEVPIAITAETGPVLEQKGIQNLQDLGRTVAGLKPQPHPSTSSIVQFNLRGQNAGDTLLTVDQAVGVYVDGVYVARPRGLTGSFFDVERVEVLKGPQGTLYGRNTTGGAISLVTKGADFDGVHGFVQGEVGDYNMYSIAGAVNVPFSDKVAVRLAGKGLWRKGFGKSDVTGQDLGQDRDQIVLRGSVKLEPTETLGITLKAEHYRSRENGTLWIPQYVNPNGGVSFQAAVELGGGPFRGAASFADPVFLAAYQRGQTILQGLVARGATDYTVNSAQLLQRDDNDVTTLGMTLDYDVSDDVYLKSITGWRKLKSVQISEISSGTPFQELEIGFGTGLAPLSTGLPGGLSGNFTIPGLPEQQATFWSQELNLGGKAVDNRLNWLLGAYYSHERGRDVQQARVLPALTGIAFANDGYKIKNDSWSVFGQTDFNFTDQLSLTLGGRYTKELKGLVSRNASFSPATGVFTCTSGIFTNVPNTATANPLDFLPITTTDVSRAACENPNSKNFSGWSYLASVNYKVTDDVLVYARTARGFRGGAFQLRSPDLAPANPETVTDYELGFKSDLFDRKVRLNLAGYVSKYKEKQESIIVPRADGSLTTVIQNAANATLKGFEGELTIKPVPGLTLEGNVTYIQGKYDSFPGALPIQGGTPVNATGERFSLPPWTYGLSGRYESAVPGGTAGVQVDWSWTAGARPSARLVNPLIPAATLDRIVANLNGGSYANGRASLGLMNARVDYKLEEYNVTLAVFVTNMLDEKYVFSGTDPANSGVFGGIAGAPRMFGVSLRKTFGGE
jgi:iron complex outermembrane receptor protein